MIRFTKIIHVVLWFFLSCITFAGIFLDTQLFFINFVIGIIFITIGFYQYLKLWVSSRNKSYPKLARGIEWIGIVSQIAIVLLFIIMGLSRMLSEGFPIFG